MSVAEFRRFMQFDYATMPQVRAYEQYHVADVRVDDAEPPMDAIVRIGFDSRGQ